MKLTINDFYNSKDMQNGLLLFDIPTGMGKTHHIIEYIAEKYKNISDSGGKIFFITPLKKNLHIEKFKMLIKEINPIGYDEKDVLFIDSSSDSLKSNFNCIAEYKINFDLFDKKLFDEVADNIEILNDFTLVSTVYKKKINEYFSSDLEPRFRRHISEKLRFNKDKTRKTMEETDKLLKENLWIERLYPSVNTKKAKIILMSLDKFLVYNDTLVRAPYLFVNETKMMKKSLIFIDEFDSSKDSILNSIIRDGHKNELGLVQIFRRIHDGMSNTSLSSKLIQEHKSPKHEQWKSPKEIYENLRKRAKEIFDKFKLGVPYKLKDNKADSYADYIFKSLDYHTILKKTEQKLIIRYDEKENLNFIDYLNYNQDSPYGSLFSLISSIMNFTNFFYKGIAMISSNYLNKMDSLKNDIDIESAVSTVLSEINLQHDDKYGYYINKKIPSLYNRSRPNKYDSKYDYSFFNIGFNIYDLEDSDRHDTLSIISATLHETTPEKIMVQIASEAKVVGISASCTLDSVTGNYSLEYLKNKLGDSFVSELSSESISRLEKHVASYTSKNNELSPEIVSISMKSSDDDDQLFDDFFGDEKHKILTFLSVQQEYYKERYLRVFSVIYKFLENKTRRSLLILMNCFASNNDDNFRIDVIENAIKVMVQKKYGEEEFDNYKIFHVKSQSVELFERQKEEMGQYLSEGKYAIIFSTYQTLGAGQNLQYRIPKEVSDSLISINELDYIDNDKDIDAIYLEKPTNIFPQVSDSPDSQREQLSRLIFYVLYLNENGEISEADAIKKIKNAFRTINGTQNPYGAIPETKSVNLHYARIILQGLGRINRTRNKIKSPLIMFHEDICGQLAPVKDYFDNKKVIPDFKLLLEKIGSKRGNNDNDRFTNLMIKSNKQSYTYIHELMGYWDDDSIAAWKGLREVVLKNPTVNVRANETLLYGELPTENDQYNYIADKDYKQVEVFFYGRGDKQSVSDKVLENVRKNPELVDLFNSKGYKINFEKNKYIMTPVLFNNIYKAAVGETIGKYLLEKYVLINGQQLEELVASEFEKFDFVFNGIYIDFKLWRQNHEYIDGRNKVCEKLREVNGRKAIIINIFPLIDRTDYCVFENVLSIPQLIDKNNQIDYKMIKKIKEFLNDSSS